MFYEGRSFDCQLQMIQRLNINKEDIPPKLTIGDTNSDYAPPSECKTKSSNFSSVKGNPGVHFFNMTVVHVF